MNKQSVSAIGQIYGADLSAGLTYQRCAALLVWCHADGFGEGHSIFSKVQL